MASAIILALAPVLAALIPFILDEIRKRQAAQSNPVNQVMEAQNENQKAIARNDAALVTARVNAALDRLRIVQAVNSNSSGPANKI